MTNNLNNMTLKPEAVPDELVAFLKVTLEMVRKKTIPADKRKVFSTVLPRLTASFAEVLDKPLRLNLSLFKPIALVGTGGWGQVWKCQFGSMSVALKKIQTSKIHPGLVYSELDMLKELQHPTIVTLLGAFFDGRPWLVMEYCIGDLYSYTPEQLGLHNLARFFNQLAQALDFMHSKDIIHRDLKPSNFLISSQNNCKIGDMGGAIRIPKGSEGIVDTSWGGTIECQDVNALVNFKQTRSGDVFSMGVAWFEISTCSLLLEAEASILKAQFKGSLTKKRQFYADAINLGKIKEVMSTNKGPLIPVKDTQRRYVREPIATLILRSKYEPIVKQMVCLDPTKRLTAKELVKCSFLSNLLQAEGVCNINDDETYKLPDIFDTEDTRIASQGFPKSEPGSISVWAVMCSSMYYDSGFGIINSKDADKTIFVKNRGTKINNSAVVPMSFDKPTKIKKRKRNAISTDEENELPATDYNNKSYLEEGLLIQCKICKKDFQSRFEYANHLGTHKKHVCWGCAVFGTNSPETFNLHMDQCTYKVLDRK